MDIQAFVRDSPLGLGWLFGHVTLRAAVKALAQTTGLTDKAIKARYGLGKSSKEEDLTP